MPKHFIIWTEGNDNIEVYTEEPVVVVKASRKDLEELKKLDEASKPGVYVLLHGNQRYIGQASGSIYSRIKSHDKNKDWWSELVFFSREDGRLDKSQLDYLEGKLIKDFTNAGFQVSNGNGGNSSHIEPYQKGRAAQTLSMGLNILKNIAHMDIFKKVREDKTCGKVNGIFEVEGIEAQDSLPIKGCGYSISDNVGFQVTGEKLRPTYVKYIESLYSNGYESELRELVNSDNSIIIGFEEFSSRNEKFYHELDEGVYLFLNLSRNAIKSKLDFLSRHLKINIVVSEI